MISWLAGSIFLSIFAIFKRSKFVRSSKKKNPFNLISRGTQKFLLLDYLWSSTYSSNLCLMRFLNEFEFLDRLVIEQEGRGEKSPSPFSLSN